MAEAAGVTILRPGLVMADTSYGGTSRARALAALPWVMPVVGRGTQRFNPIHAEDLAAVIAACLETSPGPGAHEIGGPERVTQEGLLALMRGWLGLPPARGSASAAARGHGAGGRSAMRCGWGRCRAPRWRNWPRGSRPTRPRCWHGSRRGRARSSAFVTRRPAGTQDLWHARPLPRAAPAAAVLAMLWLASGLLGLLLPPETFLPITAGSLPDAAAIALARSGGLADLALGAALLRNWRPQLTGVLQLGLVGAYTLAFTVLAPAMWLLPLGGLLKNLPILALILVWMRWRTKGDRRSLPSGQMAAHPVLHRPVRDGDRNRVPDGAGSCAGGDPAQVHGVASGVVMADWLFTTPAAIVQPATA